MYRFLEIAAGSASKLDYHLLLARDLGFIDGDEYQAMSAVPLEVRRMLTSLNQKVASDRIAA